MYAKDGESIKALLIQHSTKRLEPRMGRRFRDLVLQCLNSDFGVTEDQREDLKLQQAFRNQVVDVLERAVEYI